MRTLLKMQKFEHWIASEQLSLSICGLNLR